jgi:hypothetical protein
MKFAVGALAMLAGLIAAVGDCLAAELLMFDDPSCVWCRRWEAEIGKSYALTPEGREAPLRRIHIGKQGEAGVAFASPITVTPTFVLVENEQEVGRIAGYVGKDFFYPMLDELIRKIPPPAPSSRPALRSTMCIPGLPTSPGMARLQYHSGRPSGDSWNVRAHC